MENLLIPSPQGTTRVFVVLGDPVAQVKAPELMNRVFVANGVDAVMVPVHVHPCELPTVMPGLKQIANLDGMLITIPHKFDVCAHIDTASEMVSLSGAANALRREIDGSWSGENFDGLGFVAGLMQQGHDPAGKIVTLVGSGGAGVAIAAALLQAGVQRLNVTDLSKEKASRLAQRLNARYNGRVDASVTPQLQDADIVINSTPMGLRETDPLPFDVDRLHNETLVADIIMKPAQTRLLKHAAQRGLRVHQGIHMLAPQIEMYREYFRVPFVGEHSVGENPRY
ncbi:shikimate dehydrogenase family protein [Marinobacterium aestuariivivens]|uniref:shikimate dehydrogenase (NADP(+)) n=1 Tax=Marinobacterium aestuariivivens TaxID=1698799 RepID=A0ABW2A7H1_9GAMM